MIESLIAGANEVRINTLHRINKITWILDVLIAIDAFHVDVLCAHVILDNLIILSFVIHFSKFILVNIK